MLECGQVPELQPRGLALSPRPVLALDLGGTQIRAAVILADGTRIARQAAGTPIAEGPAAVVRACGDALEAARAAAPTDVASALAGVGVSAPGPVDPWAGTLVEPPNLGPGMRDLPIAAELEARLGLPTFLERDTNVAALGEQAFGAARGVADFLYLTVSTGIGGSIVVDGRLLLGPDGMAGELGHVPVELDGPACGCGATGHLEAVASGRALARDARTAAETGRSPFLVARAAAQAAAWAAAEGRLDGLGGLGGKDGLGALSARDVADGEAAGDEVCAGLMIRARHAVAIACAGFVNTFNPSRIVIGGSIAEHQGEQLLGPIRAEIARSSFARPGHRVRVMPAELGADVSLAGAQPLVTARLGDAAWRGGRPVPAITTIAARG